MSSTYGTTLYGEYEPLAQRIEQISLETNKTVSAVIRDALCEHFDFVPEASFRPYRRRNGDNEVA